jgi:peptidoglycan/xylan/chitin deacetylase (PgdA/CDA1 family)
MNHFDTYHHNGALILMHNDSDGNKAAMDQLITYLKEQGYRFGTLDEFYAKNRVENE